MARRRGYERKPHGPGEARRARSRTGFWMPVVLFVGLAGFFAYALQYRDPSKIPSALIGRPVPVFTLPPVEGLKFRGEVVTGFSNTDLALGKVSIVNVWASWCVPCHQEHPLLVRLQELSKAPLFGINYKDRPENARRFLGRYGNPFFAVGADKAGRSSIDWGVYGVPETFVIDGQGRVAYKHVGPITEASIRDKFLPAINLARKNIKP